MFSRRISWIFFPLVPDIRVMFFQKYIEPMTSHWTLNGRRERCSTRMCEVFSRGQNSRNSRACGSSQTEACACGSSCEQSRAAASGRAACDGRKFRERRENSARNCSSDISALPAASEQNSTLSDGGQIVHERARPVENDVADHFKIKPPRHEDTKFCFSLCLVPLWLRNCVLHRIQ